MGSRSFKGWEAINHGLTSGKYRVSSIYKHMHDDLPPCIK